MVLERLSAASGGHISRKACQLALPPPLRPSLCSSLSAAAVSAWLCTWRASAWPALGALDVSCPPGLPTAVVASGDEASGDGCHSPGPCRSRTLTYASPPPPPAAAATSPAACRAASLQEMGSSEPIS